jgi:para-nitrobenzyl esterase
LAWVSLAKTGNPNNGKTPACYDEAKRATMIFDVETRVENDPRGEIVGDQPAARRG